MTVILIYYYKVVLRKQRWYPVKVTMKDYTTVVIMDSRGRGLQELLGEDDRLGRVTVLAHSGAGAELAVLKSLKTVRELKPDLVVLATGVCDLTWRHSVTKITELRGVSVEENVMQVMAAIVAARDLLKAAGVALISVATVTGVDLTDYNNPGRRRMDQDQYDHYVNTVKVKHNNQDTLNRAVLEINRRITAINKDDSAPTTWTAGVVHSHFNKTAHHYYRRLGDGCHPNEKTRKGWARQIGRTIQRAKASSKM